MATNKRGLMFEIRICVENFSKKINSYALCGMHHYFQLKIS